MGAARRGSGRQRGDPVSARQRLEENHSEADGETSHWALVMVHAKRRVGVVVRNGILEASRVELVGIGESLGKGAPPAMGGCSVARVSTTSGSSDAWRVNHRNRFFMSERDISTW